MKLIDGKKLAKKIKDKITQDVYALQGPHPNLAIILIGERPDSQLYVDLKQKQAKTVGIDTHLYKCSEDISETELIKMIEYLNQDQEIDGILIQLPLPKQINTQKIIDTISPDKDIDGFHTENLKKLNKIKNKELNQEKNIIMPPVYGVILEMLKEINFNLNNKKVCLIANADIFENNLAELLKSEGAQVILAKKTDQDLESKTKQADLIITAIGQAEYLKGTMIKEGAILIDIGISKINNKIKGDVDSQSVSKKANWLTPVPGGVGPMTIALALKNTLQLYQQHHSND